MRKNLFLIITAFIALQGLGQSQPENLEIGLFANGSNGSNVKSEGVLEVGLRIKPGRLSYATIPVAEDFILYLKAPKSDFEITDVIQVSEVNSVMYNSNSNTRMYPQDAVDLGGYDPDHIYFPIVLNSQEGLRLNSLSATTNEWAFAFTFKFKNVKSQASLDKIQIVDKTNNRALSNAAGMPLSSSIQVATKNQIDHAVKAGPVTQVPDQNNAPTSIAIAGVFPNPARDVIKVSINSPEDQSVTLVLSDVNGKSVKQQVAAIEKGSNIISVGISNLASGAYVIRLLCKQDCEGNVAKFNKQ